MQSTESLVKGGSLKIKKIFQQKYVMEILIGYKTGGSCRYTRGSCCHPDGPDRLEDGLKGAPRNSTRGSARVLHLGKNSPMHQYMLGGDRLKAALQKMIWASWWT